MTKLPPSDPPQPVTRAPNSAPSLKRFARIPFNPFDLTLPDRAWRIGEFGDRWQIEFEGEKCILRDLRGCGLLQQIMSRKTVSSIELTNSGKGTPVQVREELVSTFVLTHDGDIDRDGYHVTGSIDPEFVGAMTLSQLAAAIADAQQRARDAWVSGDSTNYDRLALEVIELRKYTTATIGLRGRRRRVPTALMRATHAIRSALDYLFRVLRKTLCPKTAKHFSAHTYLDGQWRFTDPDSWDLGTLPTRWNVPDQRICVLSDDQVMEWAGSRVRPCCCDHRHLNAEKALWLMRKTDPSAIRWAGKHAIWMEEVRYLTTVYVDRGEYDGPGMPVTQVVPMAAPLPVPAKDGGRDLGCKSFRLFSDAA